MTWTALSPDGSKSVKQNTMPMAQNTAYTEATLNNDHFWNIGVDEDGHHRRMSMENYADTAIGAPIDSPIPTGMDGVHYLRELAGFSQPFYRNVNSIMPLLGIRAIALFTKVTAVLPTVQTLVYSYNTTSVIQQTANRYEINFTNALPNNNYIILGGGISNVNINTACSFSASSDPGLGQKNTGGCIFLLSSASTPDSIQQGWIVCFGG